ncbi:MAG: signal transduction histidine kinase [Bacteriovoracaceae bacterium]|jgi:signal transduction histidine kinase
MSKEPKKKRVIDISKYYPLFFTVIFVVILFQYSFSAQEAIFYDLRVKWDIGTSYKDNIVLITLDDDSDRFLGESYPYTYASHSKMMERLIQDEPLLINYFVNFLEPVTNQDQKHLGQFTKSIEMFKGQGGQFRFGTEWDAWGELLPPTDLRPFGHSSALINLDGLTFAKDDVCRRAILNVGGEDTIHLWTANQYRQTRNEAPLNINSILGAYYVRKADATFTLFRYYTSPLESNGRIKKIPFHRVRVGNFPKGFFTNKIVLIGPSYMTNAPDFVLTPFNKEEYKAPKLMVHAEIIQALTDNKTVYQIPRSVTYTLAIIIAIFLSVTISKVKPTSGLFITIIVMLGIFLISYILFSMFGLWLYVTHLVLTVFVVYYIWVPFRAIGEYQRRYAIQEETKLLKKVENLKQNFISLMSHDLKTPVAKIAGLADIMLNQSADEAQNKRNLQSIMESTKELNKFITSILDLTKIESRNLDLSLVSRDINTVIESTVEGLRYEAASKNVEVEMELSPLYPIEFDQNLMKRVLSNLVENAIKYSGENTAVKVKTWDDEKWVYVEIQDNGVGIPPDDLEHIFDKFYRVKNDASHSIKGTGLGLYLVKYFVELHGGTIIADSTLGQGTKFTVKLKNE